jgi:hypothetical protein
VHLIGLAIQDSQALVIGSSGGWQDFFTPQNAGLSGNVVLALVDISDPRNPQLIATRALSRASRGVGRPVALGHDLYAFSSLGAASDTPQIFLVDARDPSNLIAAQMGVPSEIARMRVDGDRVFTASPSGLSIFAVNRESPEVEAEPASTRIDCRRRRCEFPITCNLPLGLGLACADQVRLIVRDASVRLAGDRSSKASRRIRFASGAANVPPGQTVNVSLRLTRTGQQVKRRSPKRTLRGVMSITNSTGAVVGTTPVRIRLR